MHLDVQCSTVALCYFVTLHCDTLSKTVSMRIVILNAHKQSLHSELPLKKGANGVSSIWDLTLVPPEQLRWN